MKLQLDINIEKPKATINYDDGLLLIGSCFTANIGKMLSERKFNCLHNPTGILFDPHSIAKHVHDIVYNKQYTVDNLFVLNGIYNSWNHHSEFSDVDAEKVVAKINGRINAAHNLLLKCKWMVITLGSAYHYTLVENNITVANCHRAPSQWFHKKMIPSSEIQTMLSNSINLLQRINPQLNFVFTVSPVRHIRDGVVENNFSKAQLIDAVHQLKAKYNTVNYFPAYEIVIDVLRDYRFYDIDLVHPNYLATEIIFEYFEKNFLDEATRKIADDILALTKAINHRPLHASSPTHQAFLKQTLEKIKQMQQLMPGLNWQNDLEQIEAQIKNNNLDSNVKL